MCVRVRACVCACVRVHAHVCACALARVTRDSSCDLLPSTHTPRHCAFSLRSYPGYVRHLQVWGRRLARLAPPLLPARTTVSTVWRRTKGFVRKVWQGDHLHYRAKPQMPVWIQAMPCQSAIATAARREACENCNFLGAQRASGLLSKPGVQGRQSVLAMPESPPFRPPPGSP